MFYWNNLIIIIVIILFVSSQALVLGCNVMCVRVFLLCYAHF